MDASNSQSLKHVKYIMDLEPFPDDVLLVILSFVPSLDLLKSCRLVSKRWLRLVDTPTLWKIKCQQKWRKEVFNSALSIPNVNWQRIFMKEPFLRNLIRNPCGTDGLKHWRCMHGGDGWKVEDNHFPLEVADSQTSFVTSFEWCKKNQLVDLIKEGLWEDLMDNHPPSICISDWFVKTGFNFTLKCMQVGGIVAVYMKSEFSYYLKTESMLLMNLKPVQTQSHNGMMEITTRCFMCLMTMDLEYGL
ncbi:F-box only protein 27 isoform X2 [Xenopus laevis]|uniref:F-box only protein 27 isoform X2 n=1 Tax=Xenopus laevis TaxID=8355 RepID=A0A8J1LNY0_XENLA|nr:F-box only protein 27 isoform X2 [Xenopus laevis]